MKALISPTALVMAMALPASVLVQAQTQVVEQLLTGYSATGAGPYSAERGALLWQRPGKDATRRCSTCHGSDLREPGRHPRTGKPIDPLSPAVHAQRLTDPTKVEKWLLRNCKWTWGRVCTPAEKGDLLTFIQTH